MHGKVLENAFLHLLKPPVIGVQDLCCLLKVRAHAALFLPGKLHERIEVTADDGRFRAHGLHHPELTQFSLRLFLSLLGHAAFGNLLFVIGDIVAVSRFLASELLLNRLHLLVEVVVALALVHLLLHATVNALFNGKDVHFPGNEPQKIVEALSHGKLFKLLLLVFKGNRQLSRNGVGEALGVFEGLHARDHLVGDLFAFLGVTHKLRFHRTPQGFGFRPFNVAGVKARRLTGHLRRLIVDVAEFHAPVRFHKHL